MSWEDQGGEGSGPYKAALPHVAVAAVLLAVLSSGCVTMTAESDPPGASMYMRDRYIGKTPFTQTVRVDIAATVYVVLPGHDRSECPVLPEGAAGLSTVFTSAPEGAIFYKDGVRIGTMPCYDSGRVARVYRAVWPPEVLAKAGYPKENHSPNAEKPAVAEPLPVAAKPTTPSPLTGSQAWAVVVGISDYQFSADGGLAKLAFADKDATDFAKALAACGWSADNVHLLTNDKATKQNVTYALETWLRRVKPGDTVILFWAGHGWPDPEDPTMAYFACYDSKPSDPSSCWRMDRVRASLEERKAGNVLVIADTCHSGKMIRSGDPRGISVVPALDAMEKKNDIPPGWVFIVSADSDRKAYEDKAWANGALTHVLLEGLRDGKADGYKSAGAKDGKVTLGELRAYITDRMAEESLKLLGARLTPLFFTTSGNPDIWNLTLQAK